MKRLRLFFVLLSVSTMIFAEEQNKMFVFYTEIGNYSYYLESTTYTASLAGISGAGYTSLSNGIVNLLPTVTYNNVTFDVTSISDRAFSYSTKIKKVAIDYNLEYNIERIGEQAFAHSSLEAFYGPAGVHIIGEGAFRGCQSLKTIGLSNNGFTLREIGDYAYADCPLLTTVSLGSAYLRHMGNYVCENCTSLQTASIFNVPLTELGEGVFKGCTNLTTVSMPDELEYIPAHFFENCSKLKSAKIKSCVKGIGESAYAGCKSITSMDIPECVRKIEKNAFANCTGLTTITFKDGVTDLEYGCFRWCTSLTEVRLPKTVKKIEDESFADCMKLKKVYIDNASTTKLTEMLGDPFEGCNMLEAIYVRTPELVEIYKQEPYWSNYADIIKLEYVAEGSLDTNIKWGVTRDSVLYILGSGSIKNFTSTTYAPWYESRSKINSVIIDDRITSIGNYAFRTLGLRSVQMGNNVTSIGDHAFYSNKTLKSIALSNKVKQIHGFAFLNTGIESFILPESLDTLGLRVFSGNAELKSIFIARRSNNIIKTDTILFSSEMSIPDIYVATEELAQLYKQSPYWSTYKDYIKVQNINPTNAEPSSEVVNEEVTVVPESDNATLIWPLSEMADTYTLTIYKNGEVVCTLIFNNNGQLIGIAFAPSNTGSHASPMAQMSVNGMQFTVTGLDRGTNYGFSIVVKNETEIVASYEGQFTTKSTEALDIIEPTKGENRKLLRDGQILIRRGDHTYTLTGQEVR